MSEETAVQVMQAQIAELGRRVQETEARRDENNKANQQAVRDLREDITKIRERQTEHGAVVAELKATLNGLKEKVDGFVVEIRGTVRDLSTDMKKVMWKLATVIGAATLILQILLKVMEVFFKKP